MLPRLSYAIALLILFLACPCALIAEIITLKGGTTMEGSVMKIGDKYRVLLSNGTRQDIPASQVVSIVPGGSSGGPSFASVRSRADRVDAPVAAVQMWESFIDSNPNSPDLPAARAELEKWQKLHADTAERINGKWVGGDERLRILNEVDTLCAQAREQLENQTLQAIEKYERALKLYPNCYEANFALGFYYLRKATAAPGGRINTAEMDRAIKSLEAAVRLRPDSPSALSNLAVGLNFRERYEQSVMTAHRAAKIMDNKPIVENLVNSLARSPATLRASNPRVRAIMPEVVVLAEKYKINMQGSNQFHYIPPEPIVTTVARLGTLAGVPGVVGNGSGFFISSDGYLLTNRHVVEGKGHLFRVRLNDRFNTEKPAELIAIDPQVDLALLKIKHNEPVPYLKLAEADRPNPGAPCMVLGYPIASVLKAKMQVTSGEISSTNPIEEYQVTLVANTTHGNSGGPIVDRDGNVIGVLSAGTVAFNATYLRAVSAGQIRQFLEKVKDKHTAKYETAKPAGTEFDGEKLAAAAGQATLLLIIIHGDGSPVVE